MALLKPISDSFGHGEFGPYLAALQSVVVEYFLFSVPKNSAVSLDLHRLVAESGMTEQDRINEEHFANLRQQLIESPEKFPYPIDPNKLARADRWSIVFDVAKAKSSPCSSEEFRKDYHYAFTDPPYGLQMRKEAATNLCFQTIDKLFGDLDRFVIRRWSTDWSTYFDAGNEWWGAFLWTLVSNDGVAWWIGASTTD